MKIPFKQYIAESLLSEKNNLELNADIIYQKMVDALDNSHIDFGEDEINFHIGRVIKNSNIDIDMHIRQGRDANIRVGKANGSGTMAIVIDVTDALPVRDEIDTFLTKDKDRARQIKQALVNYIKNHHNTQDAPKARTKYEEEADTNTAANFESRYDQLIKKLKTRMLDYRGTVAEIEREMDTEDVGKSETCKRAIKALSKEHFGDNVGEFKKIAMNIMTGGDGTDNGHGKMMTKENKEKMDKRLDSYYDQIVKQMGKMK